MKKVNIFFVYLISFIFMEYLFKFLLMDHIFNLANINMLLFIIPFSLLLSIITNLSKNDKVNRIICLVALGLVAVWFSAQYVLRDYFGFYISWSAFGLADQIGAFASKGVTETLRRLPGIIALFIPFILVLIFRKHINFRGFKWQKSCVMLALTVITYGLYYLGLNINKSKDYSPYVLYHNVNDINLNVENFGVINSLFIDTKRSIFGFDPTIDTSIDNPLSEGKDSDTPKEYGYNVLDIDFDSLIASETNSTIKNMHEYFKNDPGTKQNEYTGIFKDKNLILFMAESFNEVAVSPTLTPTLYKLANSGFVFEDFYTPTIYSTIGGEFQELTGIYAQSLEVLSKFRSGKNSFPQGIATMFKKENYTTYAYHNNSGSFQDRDKYLPSLGFTNFKACGSGLEKLINCNIWPRSDVEMINASVNDYVNDDKFMVFYATNSGHSLYDGFNSNQMAKKHKDEFLAFNLPYSERISTYLAAQMELDRALEALIKALDEAGRLEDTVIALVGDHYPYDLKVSEVNEAASYEKDERVEINHSNFIFWNSEMETVKVDKVGSQIDVIPTIYNAFGIPYDSRLFIGKDILSTEGGLAIFANKEWVTDKGTYIPQTGKFTPKDGESVDDEYVKQMIKVVDNKVEMSRKILMNNYYSKLNLN